MNFKQNPDEKSYPNFDRSMEDDRRRPPLVRKVKLTEREQETLRYLAEGYTSEETAKGLFISKETIDSHRKSIIKKLGVSNVTAAVAYAIRNNLIL